MLVPNPIIRSYLLYIHAYIVIAVFSVLKHVSYVWQGHFHGVCVVVVVYKCMRGRLPVVVRALFILELHRCQPAACERVFSRSSTHHIRTYIHTHTTVRICQRIEGYFGREASKNHRTTKLVMVQLNGG